MRDGSHLDFKIMSQKRCLTQLFVASMVNLTITHNYAKASAPEVFHTLNSVFCIVRAMSNQTKIVSIVSLLPQALFSHYPHRSSSHTFTSGIFISFTRSSFSTNLNILFWPNGFCARTTTPWNDVSPLQLQVQFFVLILLTKYVGDVHRFT